MFQELYGKIILKFTLKEGDEMMFCVPRDRDQWLTGEHGQTTFELHDRWRIS